MSTPSFVFHRAVGRTLASVVRGEGAVLWDAEGRRYLDASGGAAVVNVGHGRDAVARAMAAQAGAVAYVHGTQFTTPVIEEYARRLSVHTPMECRLYLVSGGSEANETVMKLARAYHLARGQAARTKVLRRSLAYHGNTLGTLALSGRASLRAPYAPLLGPAPVVPAPVCGHCPLGRRFPECQLACADEVEAVIEREGPGTVSALLAEPVIGASAAAVVPPEGYDRRVGEICRRHGVLVVADEVMTGFGRTGVMFASAHSGLLPDLLTCGKGMSGGYAAVGAVLASRPVAEAVLASGGFVHGFTFSHHAVTAAACLATLDLLEGEQLVARALRLGEDLRARLRALQPAHPHLADVRGRGLLIGLELLADPARGRPFPRAERRVERLAARALAHGLVTYPCAGVADGTEGDALLLAPPFVITEAEVAEVAEVLGRCLREEAL